MVCGRAENSGMTDECSEESEWFSCLGFLHFFPTLCCSQQLPSVPAAPYKTLGGFATNGIRLTRLESRVSGEESETAQFFVEFAGHPQQKDVQCAMNELRCFSSVCMTTLDCYPAHPYRRGRSEPRNQDGDA